MIVSFSTSDLTSTIWAFFLAPASTFPPPLSESATFKTHALLFLDFHDSSAPSPADICGCFSPLLSHGMENLFAPVGQNEV